MTALEDCLALVLPAEDFHRHRAALALSVQPEAPQGPIAPIGSTLTPSSLRYAKPLTRATAA